MRSKLSLATILIATLAVIFISRAEANIGKPVDSYKGVPIYDNGPIIARSHGRHYSPSGYYWGQKWQCVEFVKRFYDVAKNHRMPDVWGHAKDFFDEKTPDGALNKRRGLRQFRNGGSTQPRADDLVILAGTYGHVAIISNVGSNFVEVVQQNILGRPRERWGLSTTNGQWRIERANLFGWLRKPD